MQEDHHEAGQVTRLLQRVEAGDKSAEDELMGAVYLELKRLARLHMRKERPNHTLQPTELVNEAYLRLANQREAHWKNRTHFFAVAARVMRRILVDHARGKFADKRGGQADFIPIHDGMHFTQVDTEHILALDAALHRLKEQDPRACTVVELRFFGGLTVEETAEFLGVGARTIKRDWTAARAWLRRELSSLESPQSAMTAGV